MFSQLLELLLGVCRPHGEPVPLLAGTSGTLGSSMALRLSQEEPEEEVVEVRLTGRSWLPSLRGEAETGILALLPTGGTSGRFCNRQNRLGIKCQNPCRNRKQKGACQGLGEEEWEVTA